MSDDFEWHPRGTADKLARYEEALKEAETAIKSLPIDVLGYGQSADGHGDVYHWPFRDELLSHIGEALKE